MIFVLGDGPVLMGDLIMLCRSRVMNVRALSVNTSPAVALRRERKREAE